MKYTLESLKEINQRFLTDHTMDDFEVNKANKYVDLIENSHSSDIPKVGDRIKFTNKYGDYYWNAHIETIDNNEAYICESPYVPFIWENKDGEINCNTSGGAWQYVSLDKLKYIGKESKTFCDWGSCGACGNGAFNIEAEVSVWEFKEENPFGDYSTKDYDKLILHYLIDDTGKCRNENGYVYTLSQQGCNYRAFKTKTDYDTWLKTYRGVEFGEHKFGSPTYVFVYKELSHLISEEEWNELKLPIDTRGMNYSIIPVKVKYDDEKHTIDVYRYTNRKENSYYDTSMIYKLARLDF